MGRSVVARPMDSADGEARAMVERDGGICGDGTARGMLVAGPAGTVEYPKGAAVVSSGARPAIHTMPSATPTPA